ncbi:hypothetical protein Q1695_004702 [Nippostrongylus brasiliensis]|nr:hypothetical protein Q1695_004702 [Nippostrongylus brasiliensis]
MRQLLFCYWTVLTISTQEHFRSILVERACRRRPSLSFCSDLGILATSRAGTELHHINPPEVESSVTIDPAASSPSTVNISVTNGEVNFEKSVKAMEDLGGLLKLPKPKDSSVEETPFNIHSVAPHITDAGNESTTTSNIEDEKTVMVFVSGYCVIHRERFVRNCHGNVVHGEVHFCKNYPTTCAATDGVIPLLRYCQRYYKHYPKFCSDPNVEEDVLQFCFAFEQFCVPETTPAQPNSEPVQQRTQSAIRKCEDVLTEARKVCSPFPHPRDTFNVLRCTNFVTNCKKFVDWA